MKFTAPKTPEATARRRNTSRVAAALGAIAVGVGIGNQLAQASEAEKREDALLELFSDRESINESINKDTGMLEFTYEGETVDIPLGSVLAEQNQGIDALVHKAVYDEHGVLSQSDTEAAFRAQNDGSSTVPLHKTFLFPVEQNPEEHQ